VVFPGSPASKGRSGPGFPLWRAARALALSSDATGQRPSTRAQHRSVVHSLNRSSDSAAQRSSTGSSSPSTKVG
jgi:hypothetical protein